MASFYHTIPEPDELVLCPYDNVHMIRWKKMPYHLMKCRKNHPNRKMLVCHFNARHEIPEAEFRMHLATCPDKHTIERHKLHEESNSTWVKGNTDVPTYFPEVDHPPPSEDWDAEVARPRIGVAARDLAGLGYIKSTTGMKPAMKRAFYDNLRKGDTEANVTLIESLNSLHVNEANISNDDNKAADLPTAAVPTFAQPGIGRGRGRVKLASTVTPGPPAEPEAVAKVIKRTKKKLKQIDRLVERQQSGETLNDEERVKIALKSTLVSQLAALESGM